MMFNKILILAALFLATLCYSQILSVEQYSDIIQNPNLGVPDNITSVRDVTGIYSSYLGHWRYIEGTKQIDFYITKEIYEIQSVSKDALTIRYEIRENGQILLENINLNVENPIVIKASHYISNGFFTAFFGIEIPCFKQGSIYFKRNESMDFATGVITQELDVYPSYFWYESSRDNCSTYQSPFSRLLYHAENVSSLVQLCFYLSITIALSKLKCYDV